MALKSRMPVWDGLTNDQFRYLEGLDRRIPARADLAVTATLAQFITAYNLLLSDLRDAKILERQ